MRARVALSFGLGVVLTGALTACRPASESDGGAESAAGSARLDPSAAPAVASGVESGDEAGRAKSRQSAQAGPAPSAEGGAAGAARVIGRTSGDAPSRKQAAARRVGHAGDWAKLAKAQLCRPTDFGPLTEELKRKLALAAGLDEAALRRELGKRAACGDAEAALTLGLVLRYGEGAGDKAAGEKFIEAAAESGNARAMAELGRLLLADEGRADGPAQADAWLRKAWAAGESEGAFLLASAQRLGLLEPVGGEVPNELMLAAAELGNAAARRLFIRAEANGDLEDATPEQVARWSEELAKTGDLDGMELWARHLREAGEHDAAIEWYRRAAAAGSVSSALRLTTYGRGDEKVEAGAIDHLRTQIAAGAQEGVSARCILAFLLAYQPQTGEVRAEILGLLRAASAQNDHRAQVTAAMIEGGVSPREAFRQQLALSNDDVYRWIAEKWRQERVDGDESAAPPAVVESVAPAYPAELVAEQMDGAVTVRFFVGEDGTVADPCVIASDHPAFSAAALEALAKWRFRPGIKDGKPVATRMQIDFPFSVRK